MNTCIPKLSTVTDIQKESVDTVSLTLRDFPSPDVGQFCMLHVFGVGEVPISVSGIGDRDTTFTIKAVGKVTEALTKLSDGDTVGIRGPFGSSWPLDSSKGKDVLVVAGGLGLAPLKPLLSKIAGNRKNFRKVILLYGTRSPSDLLFTPVLNQLEKNSDIDVLVTVDAAPAEWQGNVGAVTSLLNKVDFETGFLTAYLCGPEIMMHYTVRELKARGLSTSHIFLSLERNMHCAIGHCGRCMLGPDFVCKDGPIFPYDKISKFFETREM